MDIDIAGAMSAFSGFVWSTPTAILLTGAGLLFTLMTVGVQFKALTHGLAVIRGKYDDPSHKGNISHFQALCAALSGTIGLGNISGVAVAIASGGPGAVFWMWVVGFLGMATKFMTCTLAVMYRHVDSSGTYRGGPMYYIELGLAQTGSKLKRGAAKGLAILFALLGVCGCIGAGTMFQSNQAAKTFVNLSKKIAPGGVSEASQFAIQMIVGVVLCLGVGLVLIGGIKRLGRVAGRLVPAMCLIYSLGAIYIIARNIDTVPDIFRSIFESAFSPAAGMGAFYGVAVKTTMIQGVRRACFSNEAGMGTAPIAHATAKTGEPVREGIVAAIGPFIDTLVICTMTALVVLSTDTHRRGAVGTVSATSEASAVEAEDGAAVTMHVHLSFTDDSVAKVGEEFFVHKPPARQGGQAGRIHLSIVSVDGDAVVATLTYDDSQAGRMALADDRSALTSGTEVYLFRDGVELTALAFDRGLAGFGTYFIPVAALLFAFSTMITWGFYGETCTEYLFGERAVLPFKIAFVLMILVGTASMKLQPVLDWADGMLGLMMVPN
ncbi:MAG: alanine:cation symporter family protein, partial [Planctomycetes bacterium]|nr:alanine:cation symporter family protein [Planctomycetota bacterium]